MCSCPFIPCLVFDANHKMTNRRWAPRHLSYFCSSWLVSNLLVMCLTNGWRYAARDFGLPLGASDEHTLPGSVRSKQRRGRPKELRPEGLRRKWPGASLFLSHVSLRICSFVTPRPRPFWAQHNTSHL